jgi:hypothetical protein
MEDRVITTTTTFDRGGKRPQAAGFGMVRNRVAVRFEGRHYPAPGGGREARFLASHPLVLEKPHLFELIRDDDDTLSAESYIRARNMAGTSTRRARTPDGRPSWYLADDPPDESWRLP